MSIFSRASAPIPEGDRVPTAPDHWTPQRQQLLAWFKKDAPTLATAYEASVDLAASPGVPARTHLICHLVRDIYRRLPEILGEGFQHRGPGEYGSLVETVARHWPTSIAEPPTNAGAIGDDSKLVPPAAARAVDALVSRFRTLSQQRTSWQILARAIYRRYTEVGHSAPDRLVETFRAQFDWFTARAHLVRDFADLKCDAELSAQFLAFERTLSSLVCGYFTGKEELDAILDRANR